MGAAVSLANTISRCAALHLGWQVVSVIVPVSAPVRRGSVARTHHAPGSTIRCPVPGDRVGPPSAGVVGHVDQVATGEFVEPAEVRPVGHAVARAGAQLVPSDALDHISGPPCAGGVRLPGAGEPHDRVRGTDSHGRRAVGAKHRAV